MSKHTPEVSLAGVTSAPAQPVLAAALPMCSLAGLVGNAVWKEDEEKRAQRMEPGLCIIVSSANTSLDNKSVAWLQLCCLSGPQLHWPVGDFTQSKIKEKTTCLKISFPIHSSA